MINASEFEAAGFTTAQIAVLQRAFDAADRTSAQRFSLLQEAMNQGFAGQAQVLDAMTTTLLRIDGRLDRIEASLRDMQPPERRN